jgi:hypothetical protein
MEDLKDIVDRHPKLLEGEQELFLEIVYENILATVEFAMHHANDKKHMKQMLMKVFYKGTSQKKEIINE